MYRRTRCGAQVTGAPKSGEAVPQLDGVFHVAHEVPVISRVLPVFDTVFGLPVHVLVIHAVVVLVPLVAITAIVVAVTASRRGSRRLLPWVSAAAAGVTVLTFVASQSGQALSSRVGPREEHAAWGERVPVVTAAFAVALLLLWMLHRGRRRRPGVRIVAGLVVVLALASIGVTALAGHTGTQAVWEAIIENTIPGSQ
jgi:uncharacterized membrane protein